MKKENVEINPDLIESFEKELRRGSLVLVVLSLLKKPTHGYELLTRVEAAKIDMDTDTLYPLLRRLEAQSVLSSEWELNHTRPRKIYQLTPLGQKLLIEMRKIWFQYGKNIERITDHD
jgi:PadR family transcriptional regulator, regulatory protein PadR